MLANYATISSMAIYFLIAVAFEYANILAEEDEIAIKPLNAVQLALFSFMMLVPQLGIVDGVIALMNDPRPPLSTASPWAPAPSRVSAPRRSS